MATSHSFRILIIPCPSHRPAAQLCQRNAKAQEEPGGCLKTEQDDARGSNPWKVRRE